MSDPTTLRVSKDFVDRLKGEQDVDETLEDTLRFLLGWEDEEEEAEEEAEEEEDQDQDEE